MPSLSSTIPSFPPSDCCALDSVFVTNCVCVINANNVLYSIALYYAFSALMLLVWQQKWHLACKRLSGGVLVWLNWLPFLGEAHICIWPS